MVKNLRRLRNSKGVSQQQLADVLGITQQSVNKYENHSVEPDIHTLIAMADYFGTTVDYLIGHTPPENSGGLAEDFELNREEISLINSYRQMSKEEKTSIQLVCKNYLRKK